MNANTPRRPAWCELYRCRMAIKRVEEELLSAERRHVAAMRAESSKRAKLQAEVRSDPPRKRIADARFKALERGQLH